MGAFGPPITLMYLLARFDRQGNLVFSNAKNQIKWDRFRDYYAQRGDYFSITINDLQKQSTEAQHALFHRICHICADESGAEFIEVKKALERECLPVVGTGNTDLLGDPIIERKQLKELDIKEFNQFLEKVIMIANDMYDMALDILVSEEFGNKIINRNDKGSDSE